MQRTFAMGLCPLQFFVGRTKALKNSGVSPIHRGKCRMLRTMLVVLLCAVALNAQTMPPQADQELARDIYKQFIEVQSGFTTGSTTPVAEAAAARLRAAGFPESDIFLGGADA